AATWRASVSVGRALRTAPGSARARRAGSARAGAPAAPRGEGAERRRARPRGARLGHRQEVDVGAVDPGDAVDLPVGAGHRDARRTGPGEAPARTGDVPGTGADLERPAAGRAGRGLEPAGGHGDAAEPLAGIVELVAVAVGEDRAGQEGAGRIGEARVRRPVVAAARCAVRAEADAGL